MFVTLFVNVSRRAYRIKINLLIEEVISMADEKKSQAKKATSETPTSTSEDIEALAERLVVNDLQVLINRILNAAVNSRDVAVPELSDAQKKIEEAANLFKDGTAGPSNNQLKDSEK